MTTARNRTARYQRESYSEITPWAPPSPWNALHPGSILGRRYLLEECLGRGGTGEVWRAFDIELAVEVALKFPHRHHVQREGRALESLRHEVRTARGVVSRHVCRVFDLLHLDGLDLISMEFVDGVSLGRLLRDCSPLPLDHAHGIAAQMLTGLAAIHELGLVHCDVKPENVMLDDCGRVVIMDFSIARTLRESADVVSRGTLAYMAPERVQGKDCDARVDVFAAALVCAEMIDPHGVRDREARRQVWDDAHRNPPRLAASPWQHVLERALSIRREERPEDATALLRELEATRRSSMTHEPLADGPTCESLEPLGPALVFDADLGLHPLPPVGQEVSVRNDGDGD